MCGMYETLNKLMMSTYVCTCCCCWARIPGCKWCIYSARSTLDSTGHRKQLVVIGEKMDYHFRWCKEEWDLNVIHLYSALCIASEALLVNHLFSAPSQGALAAMQAGFRTRHISTVAINAACRNVTRIRPTCTWSNRPTSTQIEWRVERVSLVAGGAPVSCWTLHTVWDSTDGCWKIKQNEFLKRWWWWWWWW